VQELSKGVNTSEARASTDATAHYRNRRFYWLRVKLYAMVERKRAEEMKRDEKWQQRKRNSANYHPALHGQVFYLYMPRAVEKGSSYFLVIEIIIRNASIFEK